jgi:hypothetical protein
MIALTTYECTGAERKQSGKTVIPLPAAAGNTITNVCVNGLGIEINSSNLDMSKGELLADGLLARGVKIQALYKSLPRFNVAAPAPEMLGYEAEGYEAEGYE